MPTDSMMFMDWGEFSEQARTYNTMHKTISPKLMLWLTAIPEGGKANKWVLTSQESVMVITDVNSQGHHMW